MSGRRIEGVRYLVALEQGRTELRKEPAPALPSGSVRVRVAFTGVCHSDTARVREGEGPFPFRIGHEVSGTVVESAAKSVPEGSRVVAYVGDGYATEVSAPASDVVVLHPSCSLLDAALAEPLACVIGGVEMLDLAHVDHVVVVGAGFMGLMTVRYLVAAGHRVIAVEPRAKARELALGLGADAALDPADVPSASQAASPVVIEATGGPSGLSLAGELVAIDGTLGIMGYHQSGGGRRTVDMQSWNFRGLKALSLHHRDRQNVLRWIDRAQRLSAHGIVNPGQLVDSTVSLDGLTDLFQVDAHENAVKTVLQVQQN
jgi:threonine dehydrogenase-like Zn-dependent dehydrogenase